MLTLKGDSFIQDPPILMSKVVAQTVKRYLGSLSSSSFFSQNAVLVPTPKSSLMQAGTLWVPNRLASALVSEGLGETVSPCLVRTMPLPKAATSLAKDRPTALQQYESMTVQGKLSEPEEIVIVDDIVTRGATLLGAASRLKDSFPHARIVGFAAMRTVSNPYEFEGEYSPCSGTIESQDGGGTLRRP